MRADDPRHGRYAGYVAGCRDACCRKAAADYQRRRYFDHTVLGLPPRHVDKTGTVRRVQALQRIGWSAEYLSERMGHSRAYLNVTINRDARRGVHRDTAAAVAVLYDELCMTPGPSEVTRKRAERKGWPSPLAWDDIDTDPAPIAAPDHGRKTYVDHAAVERRLAGDRTVRLHPAEAAEVVRRALRAGRSTTWIETQLGLKPERYTRADAVGGDLHAVEWREAG